MTLSQVKLSRGTGTGPQVGAIRQHGGDSFGQNEGPKPQLGAHTQEGNPPAHKGCEKTPRGCTRLAHSPSLPGNTETPSPERSRRNPLPLPSQPLKQSQDHLLEGATQEGGLEEAAKACPGPGAQRSLHQCSLTRALGLPSLWGHVHRAGKGRLL